MSRIIAGRFDATLKADAAIEALQREGFAPNEIDSFYVSPGGQNAMTPVGGDAPFASEGSRYGAYGAVAGAVLGALAGMVLVWLLFANGGAFLIVLGAGLGAYVGSFVGAMNKMRGGRRGRASVEHPVEPKAGRMIAVCVDRPGTEARAVQTLRRQGARDVGRAEGQWRDGWKDFDPRAPLGAV
jgi:hypothetical protein